MNVNLDFPSPEKDYYKVYVRSITYNQSSYIEDCLNGVAIQETNFPFVHHIIDDASTDGEQDVIKAWMDRECDMEHAEYYDNDICTITIVNNKKNSNCTLAAYFLKKNMYGNPKKGELYTPWREVCPYEAICEGDDYWTNPLKLQKQVDFLDNNEDCSVCVHDYTEWIETDLKFNEHKLDVLKNFNGEYLILTLKDYVTKPFFTKTLTALYRIKSLEKSNCKYYKAQYDMTMFYALLTQGNCCLINSKMGCYRINETSVTAPANRGKFVDYNLPRLFSIIDKEKTNESKQFVYKYIKWHLMTVVVNRKTDVVKLIFKYLDFTQITSLFLKELPMQIFQIAKAKL